jgi:hypothetical protein
MNRRRIWGLWIALMAVLVMCGLIAWGQWYAVHVNVPRYSHQR